MGVLNKINNDTALSMKLCVIGDTYLYTIGRFEAPLFWRRMLFALFHMVHNTIIIVMCQ